MGRKPRRTLIDEDNKLPEQKETQKPKKEERYSNIMQFNPNEPLTKAEEHLLLAIVSDVCEDYQYAWREGAKNLLRECENFLKTDKPYRYTLGKYDGSALLTRMNSNLLKKYGEFNKIYEAKVKRLTPILKGLYAELKVEKEILEKWEKEVGLFGVLVKDMTPAQKKEFNKHRVPVNKLRGKIGRMEDKLNE